MVNGTSECPDCGLIFSRFEIATNKEAKAKKLRGDRTYIINTKKLPSDVNYWKLLLYSIFLGGFGGHCFYVGRYLRGSVLATNMLAVIMIVIFSDQIALVGDGGLLATLSTIIGIIELLWFWDIFAIITKRFKVPVAIDLEGEMLKKKQEYMESLNELESLNVEEKKESNTEDIAEKTKQENAEMIKQNTTTATKKKKSNSKKTIKGGKKK